MGIVTVGREGGRGGGGGGRAAPRRHQTCQLPLEVEGRPAHPAHLRPSRAPAVPAAPRGLGRTCRRSGIQTTRRPVLGCLLRTSGVSSVIIVIYQQLREPQFITLADAQLTGYPDGCHGLLDAAWGMSVYIHEFHFYALDAHSAGLIA